MGELSSGQKLGSNCLGGSFIRSNCLESNCRGSDYSEVIARVDKSLGVTVLGGFHGAIFLGQLNFFEIFTFKFS